MNIAIKKALAVLENYGLLSCVLTFRQIQSILDSENIIFNNFSFNGRLKERYISTGDGISIITINGDAETQDAKHLTAHALGHHFLHKGNYAYIDNIVLDKHENQAEDFAAILLVPPLALSKSKPSTTIELTELFEIPLHLAERRLKIFEMHGL
ncbi:protein of unknown function [Desulfonispora thiosulfatigenes DSM 11270]|uniref:IrrE N-terminal-like domain-containing protein n=1 Tax=Desulfonispora thiosulfatigenes DSM 11270 TaxID=656914 RepID=A0A1W1VQA5_DESTI|nr:ImmA/IrrE family metallo-endopeptidase [Desulfonispora thiosulfatigenes]SMB95555.1 protein of unknown function [Desulfonispora thiosulfatigenes DSM 11270]